LGPNRRYFIRTHSGRILSRNRRFIRKRHPLSISGSNPGPASPPSPCRSSSPTIHPPSPPTARRSSRTHHNHFTFMRTQHGFSAPLSPWHQSLVGRFKVTDPEPWTWTGSLVYDLVAS
jgi:hypothetical protein